MTDGFINSKKFNMEPSCRKTEEYIKTIMLVIGDSMIGKSTLCSLLLNDNINYISTDWAAIDRTHNIQPILAFIEPYSNEEAIFYGHIIASIIERDCPKEFVDFFFKKYIEENENLNILVDSFILKFDNLFDYFSLKCEEKGYRLWIIQQN